jgi:hypothetical protein
MYFFKFIHISDILKPKKKFEKDRNSAGPGFDPRLRPRGENRLTGRPMPAAPRGMPTRDDHAPSPRGGAAGAAHRRPPGR